MARPPASGSGKLRRRAYGSRLRRRRGRSGRRISRTTRSTRARFASVWPRSRRDRVVPRIRRAGGRARLSASSPRCESDPRLRSHSGWIGVRGRPPLRERWRPRFGGVRQSRRHEEACPEWAESPALSTETAHARLSATQRTEDTQLTRFAAPATTVDFTSPSVSSRHGTSMPWRTASLRRLPCLWWLVIAQFG